RNQPLQRLNQFVVACCESGRATSRDASIAKYQTQCIGIQRHRLRFEMYWPAKQWQFVAVIMSGPQVADHLLGLQHSGRLASPFVTAGVHSPQMVTRCERRRAVLRIDAIDLLESLRVDTKNLCRATIRTDHGIPDLEISDR